MRVEEQIEFIKNDDAQQFLVKNNNSDPFKLLLKHSKDSKKRWLAEQLSLKKKVYKKLPEWCFTQTLIWPKSVSLEQCSSEETAKIKAGFLSGISFIDITGGMGVDAFYLAKNFTYTTLYERNKELAIITKHNLHQLNSSIQIKAIPFSPLSLKINVDLIYADPARRSSTNEKLVDLQQYEPNMVEWLPNLLQKAKQVLIKTSPMIPIEHYVAQLKKVVEIWVISVRNECKEVLFLCSNKPASTLTYRLINSTVDTLEKNVFSYNQILEKAQLSFKVQNYLYEPNASIMKAGAADALSNKLGLKKLHPNTNLFTSSKLIPSFPGKTFEVQQLLKPNNNTLKGKHFNVISRNYFDKADTIAKKLRIKPSKENFLLAFTYLNTNSVETVAFAETKLIYN